MDNQHRAIKGYRELTTDEIGLMNRVKELAGEAGRLVDDLRRAVYNTNTPADDAADSLPRLEQVVADQRWVSIGATHLQEGFMALSRAVAKPTTF